MTLRQSPKIGDGWLKPLVFSLMMPFLLGKFTAQPSHLLLMANAGAAYLTLIPCCRLLMR